MHCLGVNPAYVLWADITMHASSTLDLLNDAVMTQTQQQAELTNPGLLPRPPHPPTPYALTPTSKCRARHVFIDTWGLYGVMRDARMPGVLTEEGVTSLDKFRISALPDPFIKQTKQRWPDRILALAYGATCYNGSGTIGCRGVPVSQMLKEALRQFPAGRVVMVDEFYDVSAALNIRRCAVVPGPRPTELCRWDGHPAMPKPGQPGQEWVYLPDKAMLRKWRRKWRN
ncbi:hypothetical protein QJQ45_011367 [Haematococcus lacustris]|nr:hypothetical protein QJQ45_011367 [Haematococcus lacustris]